MPDVNVDVLVSQGSLNTATIGQSIGTDGCTMCVGIVAVMNDGTRYCAHFDCASQGTPAQLPQITAFTFNVLNNNIAGVPVAMGACTTANPNMSTGAILAGIEQFFATTTRYQTNGIYVDAAGVIKTVTGNSQVKGNTVASVPLFQENL
ncbi:hypothetical protein KAT72_07815 [Aeromonas popoffii]|uniref:Uncharacterized protein n=1 Tax=Aeromonas popoffii TaxID=70856 RepID=A0ABS5GP78_9GAMM|nr:hypothetical protein [Aeromonas popoffii]MBR7628942.1 hypothetical protein [Aeromonas popoffii]